MGKGYSSEISEVLFSEIEWNKWLAVTTLLIYFIWLCLYFSLSFF